MVQIPFCSKEVDHFILVKDIPFFLGQEYISQEWFLANCQIDYISYLSNLFFLSQLSFRHQFKMV